MLAPFRFLKQWGRGEEVGPLGSLRLGHSSQSESTFLMRIYRKLGTIPNFYLNQKLPVMICQKFNARVTEKKKKKH